MMEQVPLRLPLALDHEHPPGIPADHHAVQGSGAEGVGTEESRRVRLAERLIGIPGLGVTQRFEIPDHGLALPAFA